MNGTPIANDPNIFHRWFAWRPVIFRDQYNRLVFCWFETIWRRRVPGGWEYQED